MANIRSADTPRGRDGSERLQNEAPLRELGVRHGQKPRTIFAPAPKSDVEIEHAGTPTTAAPTAEFVLEGFEPPQHFGRLNVTFDQRDGIRVIAACTAEGAMQNDRRRIEQSEVLIEPGDSGLNHTRRPAETPMRPVRADRDRVELRCA